MITNEFSKLLNELVPFIHYKFWDSTKYTYLVQFGAQLLAWENSEDDDLGWHCVIEYYLEDNALISNLSNEKIADVTRVSNFELITQNIPNYLDWQRSQFMTKE